MPRIMPKSLSVTTLLLCVCLLFAGIRTKARAQQSASQALPDAHTQGVELFRRGDNEGAIKALRAVTKQHKDDAEAWHYLGLALVKRNKIKDAQKAFTAATALRPQYTPTLTALAYIFILQGKLIEAGRFADNALKLEPQNAEAHYFAGVTRYRLNDLPRALENTDAALKANPTYGAALYLHAQVLVAMAGRALSTAYDETPDVRDLLFKKANERIAAATDSLERFVQLNPNSDERALLQEQLKTLRVYSDETRRPASEREVLSSKEVTTRAIITSKPEPSFTEQARQHGTVGEVVLRMVLGANGNVQYILPVKTLPDGLTESSVAAARRIKFLPATKDGRTVSQFVTVVYNYNIY